MTDAAMYAGTARLSLRRTVQSSILALIAHLDRHAWLLRFELPRAVFLFGDGILTTPALTGPQSRPPRLTEEHRQAATRTHARRHTLRLPRHANPSGTGHTVPFG